MHPDAPLFFSAAPEALPLYDAFEAALLRCIPATNIRVQKTQITFSGRRVYGCVSHPRAKAQRGGLLVTFGLGRPLEENSRVIYRSEPYPNRFTHHVLLQDESGLDEELMAWLREAYEFSESKR